MTELLTRNSKIKKSKHRTFNFGIPALKSASGLSTCPNAAKCAVGCYAKSGAYLFSNVARAYESRLASTFKDDFVLRVLYELNKKRVERLRIHDSGDFYLTDSNGRLNPIKQANTNTHYIDKWISIMLLAPKVQFYAYTKMISVFKEYERAKALPKNFILIYSFGGNEDALIKRNVDRHSWVFESLKQLKSMQYANASMQDDLALGKNPRIGLIYHGNKSYSNTAWAKVK